MPRASAAAAAGHRAGSPLRWRTRDSDRRNGCPIAPTIRLLSAGASSDVPRGELLEAVSALARGTLGGASARDVSFALQRLGVDLENGEAERMLEDARTRLPDLARWLEENGRELLERT